MRIALVFYPIMDMGGLTNNNNNLAAGFHELGHQTETIVMLPREDVPRNGVAGGRGTRCPHTKLEHDQMRGYTWPRERCVPYLGRALPDAINKLNSYDLVVWQIPCPTKKKENYGNMDWLDLYRRCRVPQVAYIHDGNFLDGYPWLSMVAPFFKGVGCVNHAALNSMRDLSVGYALTPSPQEIGAPPDISRAAYEDRYNGFMSLQTFKAWKHVPELIQAIPFMNQGTLKLIGGRGIDYCYLTSKDKCKWPGAWQCALDNGMEYAGVVTNKERDETLRSVTALVDPSWSKKYSTIGGHYNRVIVEAIMQGALPIVRPLGISTNLEGQGELFKAGYNCLAIPQDVTPKEYAGYVDHYCSLPYEEYLPIIQAGLSMLDHWDRKRVAQTFLDLAEGRHDYVGQNSKRVYAATRDAMDDFFGGD